MNTPLVALVTGASSGIGEATALRFAQLGIHTFGTSRTNGTSVPGVEMVAMDVTSDESIAAAVGEVRQRAGAIDILVNNAGYGLFGAVEETSLAEAQRQLDVNFWGVVRVTNAVLPQMRERGTGRIINMSSILGLLPVPFHAYYVAAKHALEGYSETLALEVAPFGVKVVLIEPSYIRSAFFRNSQRSKMAIMAYSAERGRVLTMMQRRLEEGSSPDDVAKVVSEAATSTSISGRYTAGRFSGMLKASRAMLPTALFDSVVRQSFSLK